MIPQNTGISSSFSLRAKVFNGIKCLHDLNSLLTFWSHLLLVPHNSHRNLLSCFLFLEHERYSQSSELLHQCSPFLEYSSPRYPHGWLFHFIQAFAQMSSSQWYTAWQFNIKLLITSHTVTSTESCSFFLWSLSPYPSNNNHSSCYLLMYYTISLVIIYIAYSLSLLPLECKLHKFRDLLFNEVF